MGWLYIRSQTFLLIPVIGWMEHILGILMQMIRMYIKIDMTVPDKCAVTLSRI